MTVKEALDKQKFSAVQKEIRPETWEYIALTVYLAMQDYAKEKCKEQREICAEHAEADFTIISGAVEEAYNFSLNPDDEENDCKPIEAFVINSSILNAPIPEM